LWEELIRLLSLTGQPTKAVLAGTRKVVFFIRSVSDTIFTMLFLPKPPADAADHLANRHGPAVVRGPQFDKTGVVSNKKSTSWFESY
jgi:hypothetical protein